MTEVQVRTVTAADHETVVGVLIKSWGETRVAAHGVVYDAATLPALLAERDREPAGLLTYDLGDDGLEVVTIDALVRHAGVGTALLAAVTEVARAAGASRIWLVTTNDNLDAIRFYQRRGMRIADVASGAVDAARRLKPTIPLTGAYGIPIRDELTLERTL